MTFSAISLSGRRTAAFVSLLLALGVLAAVTQAGPAQAAAPTLKASKTSIVAGEPVVITGRLSPKLKRSVVLQVKAGRVWKKVLGTKSTKSGAFKFTVRPKVTATLRAVAPAAKVSGRKRAAITSKAIKVTVVKQTATAYRLPQVAAFGGAPQASTSAKVVITARFLPVRAGRTVALQRLTSGHWTNLATAKTNTLGSAAFKLSSYPAGSLRATALAFGGVPAFATNVVNKTWVANQTTEFNGSSMPADWDYRQLNYYPGGKRNCSRSTEDMVKFGKDVVALSAAKDKAASLTRTGCKTYGVYKNGHIYDTTPVGYGIAAARVKMQQKDGQHGAFWLQSQSGNLGAEIDVAEFFGAGRSDYGLNQYIHYNDSRGGEHTSGTVGAPGYVTRTRQALGASGDDWWKNYHVYSVEWTPTVYIFRVDGVETFRTSLGLSNRPATLILSLQTSDYELPNNDGSTQTMYVDWVKHWNAG